ncbi:hypothetical protein TeGR_g2837 [Tetraparma gracilis]|uniref:RIIa domain-containing protein n=1 Tax=Tetraparma gracilis TaxID=2962635 RepID=A0ABQ6MAK2_9STRA|nr:hypothetical protein TeGR_g2837 [Tetraparma gracilis]
MDLLTPAQQAALTQTKLSQRMANEQYIRSHTELKHMISHFMSKVLRDKPEDPVAYAAHYFTDRELPEVIRAEMASPITFGS